MQNNATHHYFLKISCQGTDACFLQIGCSNALNNDNCSAILNLEGNYDGNGNWSVQKTEYGNNNGNGNAMGLCEK